MQRSLFAWPLLTLITLSLVRTAYSQTADSFNPNPNDVVYSLAVQPNGKVLLGGFFTGYIGGQPQNHLGRVNSDGSVDTSFVTGADALVNALALQPDGAIMVGGAFGTLGGQSRSGLGRLNGNGTVDLSFNPGAGGVVQCLALQADEKILVGGGFSTLAGQPRVNLGRLTLTARWTVVSIRGPIAEYSPSSPSRTGKFWSVAGSAPWLEPTATILAGSMAMAQSTPPSIQALTIL